MLIMLCLIVSHLAEIMHYKRWIRIRISQLSKTPYPSVEMSLQSLTMFSGLVYFHLCVPLFVLSSVGCQSTGLARVLIHKTTASVVSIVSAELLTNGHCHLNKHLTVGHLGWDMADYRVQQVLLFTFMAFWFPCEKWVHFAIALIHSHLWAFSMMFGSKLTPVYKCSII